MIDPLTLRGCVESSLNPGRFFVAPPRALRVERIDGEDVPWELFRGHLLDAAQTTASRQFQAWHLYLDDADSAADTPLVSLYHDRDAETIYVIRRILVRGHAAYEDPPGVIQTRAVEKWTRELVGTIGYAELSAFALGMELSAYLELAIVGTSRLPITSLESPLPSWSLGQLGYLPRIRHGGVESWTDPITMLWSALGSNRTPQEIARALEMAIRAVEDDQLPALIRVLDTYVATNANGWEQVRSTFAALFQQLALSPYTNFVPRLVAVLLALHSSETVPPGAIADTIASMLRQLCRHLTAFDLTTFHNFGANYPDALFLDALLKAYLQIIGGQPERFLDSPDDLPDAQRAKLRRRRALRQACLVRKHYEGHLVPDAPTSQGENLRVLPAPIARVPEEQIVQKSARRRALYADDVLESVLDAAGQQVLRAALDDLQDAAEMRELGTALFLDRPLGLALQPGEVDRTPLMSYVACSRSILLRRIRQLERAGWISSAEKEQLLQAAEALAIDGLPISSLVLEPRPGVVSLADARQAATDFVLQRTAVFADFAKLYDFSAVEDVWSELIAQEPTIQGPLLVSHSPPAGTANLPLLRIYDRRGRQRLELGLSGDGAVCYVERSGVERPARLQVLRVWRTDSGSGELAEQNLCSSDVWLEAKA